jgi:hypothetical protein
MDVQLLPASVGGERNQLEQAAVAIASASKVSLNTSEEEDASGTVRRASTGVTEAAV